MTPLNKFLKEEEEEEEPNTKVVAKHRCQGFVYAECGPRASHTLQHGLYMRIHPGMNIKLFIRKSSNKTTYCLLSRRIFL